ncbi:hypothetical protein C8N24_0189 [Solirubrobacter pauli]|uniref:Uncharacterized protein n=1 Tax=Solirubrobacter pauli TaxID=166793 RepID=A0A660L5X5_9ACTN|nr:hypothetical protein [Solirubrobacter pauli]RKQ90387.1 hypothetical protein C8N24_0189 [Solirubrobacter pauli]
MSYFASIAIAAALTLLLTTQHVEAIEIRFWWRWVRGSLILSAVLLLILVVLLGAGGTYLVDHYIRIETGWIATGLVAGALAAGLLRIDTAAFDLAGAAPARSGALLLLRRLDELVRTTERDAVKRYVEKLSEAEVRKLAIGLFEMYIRGGPAEEANKTLLVQNTDELDAGDGDAVFRLMGWCVSIIHEHRIVVAREQ